MAGASDVFEHLYSRFVLRDLFAKIAPGSVVLVGVALGVTGDPSGAALLDVVERVDTLTFAVPLLGISWILGFFAQRTWNLSRILTRQPVEPPPPESEGPWLPFESSDELSEHIDRFMDAQPDERTRANYLERISVIKEAAGNATAGLVLAFGFWSVSFIPYEGTAGRLVRFGAVAAPLIALGWLEHAVSFWKEWSIRSYRLRHRHLKHD